MERADEDDSFDESNDADFIDLEQEEKIKKFSQFNFSGMSFKDYVGNIKSKQKQLNSEVVKLVSTFIDQKTKRHHGIHLSQRKMQVKHPIFKLIS